MDNEEEDSSATATQVTGCPSETVRGHLVCSVCSVCDLLPRVQAMAGQADVCKGCPGRQLCLSQGVGVACSLLKGTSL